MAHSYTYELEQLILNKLLPAYERYCEEHEIEDPYQDIDPELIRQIKRKRLVAALFKPKTW